MNSGVNGSPVVLIHGFSASPVIWSSITRRLPTQWEVLVVTLDGHVGGKELRPEEVSVEALADGIERDMDAAGFATALLVGNSLGGWLALELARRGRASGVVALAPGGAWEPGSRDDLEVRKHLVENGKAVRRLLPVLLVANRWSRLRGSIFAGMAVHGDSVDRSTAETMLRASAGFRLHAELIASMFAPGNEFDGVGVNCPVLLLWGSEDKLTAVAVYGQRMRDRLRQAEWRELPDVGHIPMLDAPEEVASMILSFAESCS